MNTLDHILKMERRNMKKKFYEHVNKRAKRANSLQMSSAKYLKLVEDVKVAKSGTNKENRHYWLLKHYDVITENKEEKLVTPGSRSKDHHVLYYVAIEELFDILYETHASIGHGGRDRMRAKIHRKYKNITVQDIQAFLNLCESCLRKRKSEKKEPRAIKPLVLSRNQVDFIDLRSRADGEFNYVMIFQDCLTKFVVLRALKSKEAMEVAEQLLDIFLIFGAPSILQTENGGKVLVNAVIESLKMLWPEVKMISGRCVQGSQSRHCIGWIERLLNEWMQREGCGSWSKGLGFVQFDKNRGTHRELKTTPYEATFGQPARVGLKSSSLPDELLRNVNSEEELENVLYDLAAATAVQKPEFPEDGVQESLKRLQTESFSIEKIIVDVDVMESEEL